MYTEVRIMHWPQARYVKQRQEEISNCVRESLSLVTKGDCDVRSAYDVLEH